MRALTVGIVIGLTAGLLIQHLRSSNLRKMNQQLERNVAELQKDMAAREPAPVASTEHAERLELLRLRNQAAQLRVATNELQQLRMQASQSRPSTQTTEGTPASAGAGELVPREAWSFAGYATPEAAFQSMVFAMSQGDHTTYLASTTGEQAAQSRKKFEEKTPEEYGEHLRRETAKVTSYRILEKDEVSPDETVLVIYAAGAGGLLPFTMQKVGNEWKVAGPATDRRK